MKLIAARIFTTIDVQVARSPREAVAVIFLMHFGNAPYGVDTRSPSLTASPPRDFCNRSHPTPPPIRATERARAVYAAVRVSSLVAPIRSPRGTRTRSRAIFRGPLLPIVIEVVRNHSCRFPDTHTDTQHTPREHRSFLSDDDAQQCRLWFTRRSG